MTLPATSPSPRPQQASTTNRSVRPLTGSRVNRTPPVSACTICWTTTAIDPASDASR
ncbi:hypothetical protein LUX73_34940 [Actinomadura madurae]|nr:hypothetical protein [Actinomadura madurae]MCQ0009397.1 hypothetical protein [Actinomadura madurae]